MAEAERYERLFEGDRLEGVDPGLFEVVEGAKEGGEALAEDVEIGDLPVVSVPETEAEAGRWAEARRAGEEALRSGRVGAFLAAGGQGARLGFEGPKGTFPIGPVTGRTLFHLYAEAILARVRRHGSPVPWLVMTSEENHAETEAFFRDRGFFGVPEGDIRFLPQRMLPAFSPEGKILLQEKDRLFMNPDGHGGALRVLCEGGGLSWFRERGVDTLFYFQVDNPLLPVLDPAFLGHHFLEGSQFSTKVVSKTGPEEKMGVFAVVDGTLRVVEYIHLPASLSGRRDASGRLLFWAGNMAVHVIDLSFVERFRGEIALPFHVARKPATVLDASGGRAEAEALKLETFIFDAIPLAERSLLVEAVREEAFAPVKAAEGTDTPARARRMMTAKAARWLAGAGASVPRDESTGAPAHPIELSPLTALEAEDLVGRVSRTLTVNGPTVL